MPKFLIERKHGNIGLFGLVVLIYIVLLGLFAWQTLLFVNILFPDSDLTMKILTVASVDGMGFVWALLHTFYSFAHPYAKVAVRIGWGVTYFLSALMSVLYLVFTYMLDFQHVTDPDAIRIGVGASIAALMFNLALISVFLLFEIVTRFPNEDEFEEVEKPKKTKQQPVQPPASTPVQPAVQVDQRSTQQDLQDWVSVWMRSTDQQNGMPFLSWLEEMGSDHVKDATMALARKLYPVKPSQASPLQQPIMNTTNGNGRSPK